MFRLPYRRPAWPAAIAALLLLAAAPAAAAAKRQCMDAGLCFATIDTGPAIEVWLETAGPRTLTLAFRSTAKNMVGDTADLSLVVAGPTRRRLLDLKKPSDKRRWRWSYDFTYHIGAEPARHDDTQVYRLPYPAGRAFRVSQSFGGRQSHHGRQRYAIDWPMPVGSPVLAARGGVVVGLREDANRNGAWHNNYIWIEHADGTVGHYYHLKQDGVLVNRGQPVVAGQPIGLSGNTGDSTGPHLHFHVSTPTQGAVEAFRSFPIRFRTEGGRAKTLRQGRSYRAPAD